jgi:hypothetical protein
MKVGSAAVRLKTLFAPRVTRPRVLTELLAGWRALNDDLPEFGIDHD